MDELNLYLQSLIQETCSHLPDTPQRRKAINSFLRVLLNSGQILTRGNDIYEEALYKTMFNLTKTLCDRYDSSRGSFLTWFKTCLRHQYRDEIRTSQRHLSRRQTVWQMPEGDFDPLDSVAAPSDASPLLETWEAFVQWIKDDPDHILKACHIENNPKANCQTLAHLKLIVGKEWQEIAVEVGSPRGAISSHWSRKCQPLLQKWLEQNQRLVGEDNG
jgi:DNA-directed RNA polymerase specialized sigma24 family protein